MKVIMIVQKRDTKNISGEDWFYKYFIYNVVNKETYFYFDITTDYEL